MAKVHRNIVSGTGMLVAAVAFVAVNILADLVLSGWRIDMTDSKLFTLSEGTLNTLEALDEPVRLDFYFSKKAVVGYPTMANYGSRVRDMLLEYEAHSDGMLELNIIDPETFSEEEDQAVAAGLQSVQLNNTGDRAYFGLVGSNSTDTEKAISFFHVAKEASLEYDVTKLIYSLSYPDRKIVGIISSLPLYADPPPALAGGNQQLGNWSIIPVMEEFFVVRDLGADATNFVGIDVLMIVHPKGLKGETLLAIDQYLLNNGKAMIFVDPLSESERGSADPTGATLPDVGSDLNDILAAWGFKVVEDKVAGDIATAMSVQVRSSTGVQQMTYLPWLRLAKDNFNQTDFATSQLKVVHIGTAGIIERLPEADQSEVEFTPLLETSPRSMKVERDFIMVQSNPKFMLDNFQSENKKQVIAARIRGTVPTAYPDGAPVDEDDGDQDRDDNAGPLLSEGEINVILVADTDILSDIFWIRKRNVLGIEIPQTIANNSDFVVNALENLSGSKDLASLRTRGEYTRPFERVEEIRRQAELEYRESEQQLIQKLQETEQKINALQRQQNQADDEGGAVLLTARQSEEIRKYQVLRIDTRKQLRAVQHNLRKNIESLGTQLRIINIILIPLIIIIMFGSFGLYRMWGHR